MTGVVRYRDGALWLAGSGLAGLVLQPQLEEHPTAAQ
jgi:hypothetical protein